MHTLRAIMTLFTPHLARRVLVCLLMLGTAAAHGQSVTTRTNVVQKASLLLAQNVTGKVNIEVMVVHASNAHNRVDPALQPVMQHLRFTNFKGFKMLSKEESGIGPSQDHTYSVAGGRRLKVRLLERDAKRAKIRIEMFNAKNKILDTTVSIHRNKSFMVAGPKHEGGVLVLPLTARY